MEYGIVRSHVSSEREEKVRDSRTLREKPKKTKKFADSKELKLCKECGKGFQSMKALCGHMACHSDKERVINNKLKDGHSDTESSGPKRRRAWKKSVGVEREQEEVAISLMLLSRDSRIAESSSNDSVVLEPVDTIIGAKKKYDPEPSGSENSDSGYFRNRPKKTESVRRSEFKKLEVESGSAEKILVNEASKYALRRRSRNGVYKTEAVLSYFRNKADYASNDETETERNPQKRSKKTLLSPQNAPAAWKKSKGHECPICLRMFKSGQALGGHKRSHFVGGSNSNLTKPEPEIALLFDLNLPAPMEDQVPW